jgi:hypothetical protein
MPKLPVVKSRQSRVSGQPSQVAGALIPDNTQHSWRNDVGKGFTGLASRGAYSWLCERLLRDACIALEYHGDADIAKLTLRQAA